MSAFWCREFVQVFGFSSGMFGEVGGIRNFLRMSQISTHFLALSFSHCVSLFLHGRTERKRNNCTLLSNSHQPCINPQGNRENLKHESPWAKYKKCTTVRPWLAACVICKGPAKGCQSHSVMRGRQNNLSEEWKETRGQKDKNSQRVWNSQMRLKGRTNLQLLVK